MQTENNTHKSTTACEKDHIDLSLINYIQFSIIVIVSIIILRFIPYDPNEPHDLQCYKSYTYINTNNATRYYPQAFEKSEDIEYKEYDPIGDLHKEMDEHDRLENEYIEGYRMYKKELHEPEPLHLDPLHEHE